MAAFKFLVACGVACLGLLLFAGVAMTDGPVGSAYVPKDGEVVAIRSVHTGRYLQVSQTTGKLDANASQPTERTALFRVTLVSHAMVEMLVDAVFTTNKANWATRKQTTQSGCPCSGYSNDHGFGMYCYSWEYEAQTPWCYVLDSCDIKVPTVQTDSAAAAAAATGRGSFGRKYEDCDPFEPDYADEYAARYGTRTIEGFSWESEPGSEANITQQWDDVSNFTGAGDWDIENWGAEERPWEEGERPWWADPTNKFDEGEEEEYRYIGCNCPTYCDTHGYVYRGESFNDTAPPTRPPPPPPQPLRVSERGCPCSGFVNSHGFGGHCASWEFEGQRPWCYVQPNCSRDAAAAGSFGHPYEDCALPSPPPPPPDEQALAAAQARVLAKVAPGLDPDSWKRPAAASHLTPTSATATPSSTSSTGSIPASTTPNPTSTNAIPASTTPTPTATNAIPASTTPTPTPASTNSIPATTPTSTPTNPIPASTSTPTSTIAVPASPTRTSASNASINTAPTSTTASASSTSPTPTSTNAVPPTADAVLATGNALPTKTHASSAGTTAIPSTTTMPATPNAVPATANAIPATATTIAATATAIPANATAIRSQINATFATSTTTPSIPATATAIPATATAIPATATAIPATATAIPATATAIPAIATAIPATATAIPATATAIPATAAASPASGNVVPTNANQTPSIPNTLTQPAPNATLNTSSAAPATAKPSLNANISLVASDPASNVGSGATAATPPANAAAAAVKPSGSDPAAATSSPPPSTLPTTSSQISPPVMGSSPTPFTTPPVNNATSTPPASHSISNGTAIAAAPDAHVAARRALSGSGEGRRLSHRPPARVEEAVRLVRQQAAETSRRQREAWVSRQLRAQTEGRRLKAVRGAFTSVAGVGITSQAYNPNQQWVLLRSLQTNTLIGVEPPPHAEAMGAHGRSDSISLKNVFAFFRGGFIWSRATDSLLNVCTTSHEICTGYLEKETDPHLKRLQHPMESARFTIIPVASAASSSNPNWTPA